MRNAILLTAVALMLGACSLCPDGYEYASSDGTYGFAKCEEEKD